MSARPRFELKYRLDPLRYRAVLNTVARHMRPDGFTRRAGPGGYYVRSLYYDTAECTAYVEKVVGAASRIKLRLRSYSAEEAAAPFVSVELKCRQGQAIIKHAARVPLDAYRAFAATGSWHTVSDPVCQAFERVQRRTQQRPTVLVDYRRAAFVARGEGGARVTFDHRVRAAWASSLFARPRWRAAQPLTVVLEIKTGGRVPPWLQRAIVDLDLVAEPNSKYTQGMEQAYPALLW